MGRVVDFLFNGGMPKKDFLKIFPRIREENRKNLILFSSLTVLAFTLALIFTAIFKYGMGLLPNIIILGVFLVVLVLSLTVANKSGPACDLLVYLFIILLLGAGIVSGIKQPNERTTLLLVFFVFSSVIYAVNIVVYAGIMIAAELLYLVLAYNTQSTNVFTANALNTLIFCILGIFSAVFMMITKIRKHKADYKNQLLLERDPLTMVYNRFVFDREIERVITKKIPVVVGAFDINGLKSTNDKYGHAAGDELICGATQCLCEVFGEYGKVFRTGGDEFFVIMPKENNFNLDELKEKFKTVQNNWGGHYIKSINISSGFASVDRDYETLLIEALKRADFNMYEDKQKYYAEKTAD